MAASSFVDTLLEQFDIALSQHQRLLKLDVPAAGPMLPHRLVGQEAMGQPFRYRLDCISQRGDIELKTLMAQPATLSLMQADGSYRDLNGLVEEAALLGEDGGVYYYQLTLVPWFSLLKLGRDSRIFQNLNVVDIATQVFDAHAEAAGRYRFDTRREYPPRSYCVQYRESDYHFVSRLFEEEGLFYYFEQSDGQHTLVITDDVDTCTPVSPQQIRFHRQDATESEDAITQWRGLRQLQPTRVTMGTFDYKQPSLTKRSALNTVDEQGNVPDAELYDYAGEYYYHEFDRGERLSENRLEAHESKAKRFHGAGGTRQLQAGYWFELTQHSRHDQGGAEEREFLVLGMTVHAENSLPITAQLKPLPGSLQPELDAAKTAHGLDVDAEEMADGHIAAYRTGGTGHFLIDFEAQRRTQPFRNARRHPRPVVGGPQTALIVGPEGEEIHTDHLNRVRAQFHWDRQGQLDENSSCWLRVAQPNAGSGWGGVFTPRVGQEVIVDFLEGDPDRPLITGRVYNGDQTPEWHSNGLFSGLKSKTYRGSKYNELLFDDATDQERVRLNSEHQKSQLNLGYLIHQNGNYRGAFRGTGFELRTDAYGTVRANQGLYLTSWGQIGASGEQLALDPAKTQLDAAYELTDTLSQVSADHNAETLDAKDNLKKASDDTDAPYGNSEQDADADQSNASAATASGGRGQVQGLKAPWLHLASPAGTTISTPESTHLAQGQHLSVSTGENLNLTSGKNLVAAIREKLSLFAYNAGIKLFAAKGKVEIQAQSDTLEMTAEKDVKISSTEHRIEVNAKNGIVLTSGGAYIQVKDGNIQVHAPGTVDVKAALHLFSGPTQLDIPLPDLPQGGLSQARAAQTVSPKNSMTLNHPSSTGSSGATAVQTGAAVEVGGAGTSAGDVTAEASATPSFAEQMRGTAAQAMDYQMAQMAQAVYTDEAVGDWKPLDKAALESAEIKPKMMNDQTTGFQSAIYSNGQGDYVLAYAGTDFSDWKGDWMQANIPQAMGRESEQYQQALHLAEMAKQAYGDHLVITGHSLGGGLASVASLATDTPAVTFNAAGIADGTLERLPLDPEVAAKKASGGLIRRYNVDGEILTWEQEDAWGDRWLFPDALGKEITLADPTPVEGWSQLNPVTMGKDRINDHGMDTVLDALDKAKPWRSR
ncbi:type VI secretion system tip protein TssI/VgrG [Terasakiispira papahanaumokuakeensis]|uniref:type VI secretion system tip protein TssI/VgrG n=1 Tax=Terasakiispira papahanaumokuakeensis TaxID=197479 RepID=UPI000A01FCCC|nr:type VI secretion system tip protein TssI/VgrG [Terasakiispira papahanaumokuakeensis]